MGRLTYVTFTWQCWADSGLDFTGEPGEAVQGRRTGGAARPHSTGKMTWADGQEERVGCWIIRRLALSAPPTRLILLLLNLSSSRSMCDVTDMFWNDLESHGHRRCWNLDSSHIGIFPQSFPDLLKTLRRFEARASSRAAWQVNMNGHSTGQARQPPRLASYSSVTICSCVSAVEWARYFWKNFVNLESVNTDFHAITVPQSVAKNWSNKIKMQRWKQAHSRKRKESRQQTSL